MWTLRALFLAVAITLVKGMCYPEHMQSQFCRADYVVRARVNSGMKFDIPDLPDTPAPMVQTETDTRPQGTISRNSKTKNLQNNQTPVQLRKMAPEPRVRRSQALSSGTGAGFAGNTHSMIPQYHHVTIKRFLKGIDRVKNSTVALKPLGTNTTKYPRYSGRVYIMSPEFQLLPGKWYLLSGKINQNKLWVSFCDFHHEWEALDPDQLHNLKKNFIHGCNCNVKHCFDDRCTNYFSKDTDLCTWVSRPDSRYWPKTDCNVRHSTCLSVEGKCQWKHSPRYDQCKRNKASIIP